MKCVICRCLVGLLLASAAPARADIFQWEYINPGDPGQGKQQSTTLAPDGAGQNAQPDAFLAGDLTMAYLIGVDLRNAYAEFVNLTDADLSQANLTRASFFDAQLTGADFTGAEVRGASFYCDSYTGGCNPGGGTGLTPAQLSSTASYAAHDLTGIGLDGNNLADVDLSGQTLTDARFYQAMLTGANLSNANLSNTYFYRATLTGADFTGADVRGAVLELVGFNGFTAAQLYATASYQAHDLTGISLAQNQLTGWNFAGQNLTNADFALATFDGADFTGAEVRGANFHGGSTWGLTAAQLYSTASYQAKDLTGIAFYERNVAGWNFAGQNLTNAIFQWATLTGADFTGAEVRGASFGREHGTGLTPGQLYSTASYQAHDLTGIDLSRNNLAGSNFAGQNLTNANFYFATLTGADFSGAIVRGANFSITTSFGFTAAHLYSTASYQARDLTGISLESNNLTGWNFASQNLTNAKFFNSPLYETDFAGADARGARDFNPAVYGATTTNMIQPDGHINGLDLGAGRLLVVRDNDGGIDPYGTSFDPIPVTVDQHFVMSTGGTLRIVFEADAWHSTISFANGISVTLGGSLDLTFADGVDLASQIGRTFDVFDWTGVTPTGVFAVDSSYVWDLSKLDTTGEVMFLAASGLPGDFNNDNSVDTADYVKWRKGLGATYTQAAYNVWQANFGRTLFAGSGAAGYGHRGSGPGASAASLSAAVPEPASLALVFLAAAVLIVGPRGGCPAKNSC